MKVLIVSPNPAIANDLRNELKSLDSKWEVEHSSDTASSLQKVQDGDVHVLMVEIGANVHGLQLLKKIREASPSIIRFMLMPEDSQPQGYAMELAHRHLHLPLDGRSFVEAVGGVEKLLSLLKDPEMQAMIGKIDKLPTQPDLYFAISRALGDPDASTNEIARLITGDALLAAKVLRVSNSAYFSRGRPIADLKSAVMRLGLEVVRRVVLAAEVFPNSADSGFQKDIQARAMRASFLAGRMLNGPSAELAATAALLAEVGRLLPGFANREGDDDTPGFAEAGAWMLGLWGLPMMIVEAVAHHRHPQRAQEKSLGICGAVHIAHALSGSVELNDAFVDSINVRPRLEEWKSMIQEDL